MARSIFALTAVLLALSVTAQAQDVGFMFCGYGLFMCPEINGSATFSCINYTLVCDGNIQCYNGQDESFCGNCSSGYMQCPDTTTCISNNKTCDGVVDCMMDGADESVNACGCINENEVPVCSEGNSRMCLNRTSVCDGSVDCANGLDEGNCSDSAQDQSCPYGMYNCPDLDGNGGRTCISYNRICDGTNDCYNGTDESFCGDCPMNSIACQSNMSVCVENSRACDGTEDCPDGCDESVATCGIRPFTCANGGFPCGFNYSNCWLPTQACDDDNDCGDELAFDEIAGFVESQGVSCTSNGSGGSGSGFFGGMNLVIGLLAPPFDDAIVFPESEGYFDFCIVRGGLSSDDEFSVTVTTTGGNAVAGYDYENATQTLNFGSEDSMMCINVTIIDDDKVEGNETFTISLSVNTTDVSYTFVGPMQATVIIVDNDGVRFDLATNGNVTESDDATFDLCITLTDVGSGLERDVSFEIRQQYSGYNETRNGLDFNISNYSITIPRTAVNGTETCFSFANVINDQRIEDTEIAVFYLVANNYADMNMSFTINIIDDEFIEFEFFNSTELQVEEGRTVRVCLTTVGNISAYYDRSNSNIDIMLNVTSDTADSRDYVLPTSTYYNVNTDVNCFTFYTSEDDFIENTEVLYVTVLIADPDVLIGLPQVNVYILDRDSALFESYLPLDLVMREADWFLGKAPRQFCFLPVSLENLQRDVTLNFTVTSLGAMRDEDFMINDTELTLYHQGNMTLVCLELVIINDMFIEDLERFAINVVPNNPNDRIIGYNRTEISIEDNDFAVFVSPLDDMSIIMRESDWSPESPPRLFCVRPDNYTSNYLRRNVQITFINGEVPGDYLAAMIDEDFTLNQTQQVFYYQTSTEVCLQFRIINDMFIENYSEMLILEITVGNNNDTIEGPVSVHIVINDNDFAEFVSPFDAMIAMRESDWSPDKDPRPFCLVPTNRTRDYLRRSVEVTFTPSSLVGAMMGDDFMLYGTSQTFSQDNTSICLQLRIINDRRIEETESFAIAISLDSTYDSIVGVNRTEISIADDDYIVVELEMLAENGYVSEGVGNFSVSIVLVNVMDGLDRDVAVNLTVGVMAPIMKRFVSIYASSDDFSPSGDQVLNIPRYSMNGSVFSLAVTIAVDEIVEHNEGLRIMVNPGDQYQLSGEPTVVVTIIDDDNVYLSLSTNEIMSLEGGEINVTVYIMNSVMRDRDVEVNVTIDSNNADANYVGDFNQLLVIAPDINFMTVTIPVGADNIVGPDKMFTINFNPINSLDSFINGSSVAVTIIESANLTLTQSNMMGMEGGSVEVCVAHAHMLEDSVSVKLTLMTGTAEENDFRFVATEARNYTLTFTDITTSSQLCVTISLDEDQIAENVESFVVVLTAIDTDDTIGINSTTITINDNDGVMFSTQDVVINETNVDQRVLVCVTMTPPSGGLDRNAAVTYMYGDSGALMFSPTNTELTQCINVTVVGDKLVENNETVTIAFIVSYPLDGDDFSAYVTIVDDDSATVSFSLGIERVFEDVGEVSVCVMLVDVEDGLLRRTVQYIVTSDQGTEYNREFNASSDDEQCITVVIVDDEIVEGPVDRLYTLTVVNGNDLIGDNTTFTITESDNDGVVITLMPIGDVMENQTVDVEFSVEGMLEKDIIVTVSIVGDIMDAMIMNGEVTVSSNGTFRVELVVTADNIIESLETYTVQISSDNAYDVIEPPEQNFTIIDQDGARIVLDLIGDITETNEDFNVTVSFAVEGVFERPSTVTISLVPAGTSDVRIVYDVINVYLTGNYTVTLVIVGDELIENNKDFELVFTSDNTNDVIYQGPDMIQSGSLSLTVIDDDGAIFTLAAIDDVIETDVDITIPINFTVTGLFERMSTVTVRLALESSDVIIANGMVNVSQSGSYSVDLVVIGDEFVEAVEAFTVEIVVSNPLDMPGTTQTFTVADDDGVVITLMPIGDVMENQTVDVEFSVEGMLEKDIIVTVSIVGDIMDAMIMNGEVTVSSNGTFRVELVVTADNIIESPETYTVQISSNNTYDVIEPPAQNFTIIDQDGARIVLDLIGDITETDEDFNVTVSFAVEGVFERPSTVTVSLVPAGTSDVRIVNDVINVDLSGDYTVTLVIVGDEVIENNKDFELVFTSDNTNDVIYQGPDMIQSGNLSLTVIDDDGAIFTLAAIDDVTETDVDITISVSFTVTGLFERMSTVTVRLALESGETISPSFVTEDEVDVSIANGMVTVPESGSYSVDLVVVGDEFVEAIETFIVEIVVSNPLDMPGATRTLTVFNDDGADVSLETTMFDLAKGDSVRDSTQVCLKLTSDPALLERNVTIRASFDDSALSVDSELAISREAEMVCFKVSVIDDGVVMDSVSTYQVTFSLGWTVDNFDQDSFITTIYVTPLVTDVNYTPFIDILTDDGVRLQRLIGTDDGCSDLIYVNSGLPYGSRSEESLRVCANGAISIGAGHFNFFSPLRFPSSSILLSSANVMTPYWNDHDLRGNGSSINYKVYTREQGGRVSGAKLDSISRLISNKHKISFSGMWMLVAEWGSAPAYPFNADQPLRNTYQAVVCTDGTQTFAVYTYNCEQLQWESGEGSSVYSVIGYNINPNNAQFSSFASFINHPLSAFQGVRSVACVNDPLRVEWSNLVYLVGNDTGASQLSRAGCINRADKDRTSFNAKLFQDAPCPCSVFQARVDNRYYYISYYLFKITGDFSFSNSICYVQRFPSISNSGVQLCCYGAQSFNFGALLGGSTAAGVTGSSLLRFHPVFQQTDYILMDYNFRTSCCVRSDLCVFYSDVRPSHNCIGYRSQRRAWAWGDPHITTVDGDVFTFNGWGEYSLLELNTSSTTFALQGRTGNISASEGSATKLIAFAFGMSTLRVQVDVNGDTGLTVLFNGDDISANVSNVNDTFTTTQLSVSRDSENAITTSFADGIGVTVTASFGMLSFVLSLPEQFQNLTRGLMGNYNGDPMDDIVYRNGTMLAANVSDRMIHDFGQSWEISPEDSFFTYPVGMSAVNYSFPNHVPIFADEAENVPDDVLAACGDNQECIFDAVQTGNLEIGMETLTTNAGNIDDQNQASNSPPQIMGPSVLRLDIGVTATLSFNISDDKDIFNITVVGGLPDNSELMSTVMDGFTEYEFTWTLSTVQSARSIMFEARDELNASAVLNVQVQICACMNKSDCTIEGIADATASSIVLNCECSEAWMGDFCTEDVDGCTEFMCFEGVDCIDVRAPGVGAECVGCPGGYVGDGEKCEDINECNGTHGCSQICNNIQGSFECLCNQGYRLTNATYCEDVNECDMLNGRCHQMCTNNEGSHNCSCFEGYELSNDNLTCTVLPMAVCPDNNTCSQNCVSLSGVETCSCNPGYQLDANNQTCSDVNECLQVPCNQGCNNTDGNFVCYCRDGYTLQPDTTTCIDINECLESAMRGMDLCQPPMFCQDVSGDNGKFNCLCPDGTILDGNTCVLPTTPPPTIIVPTGTVPPVFRDNAVVITLPGLTAAEFGETRREEFRKSTANAINAYCGENTCTPSRKRQVAMVTSDDVIIENVRDDDRQLTFDMYVQSGGSAALPASAVQEAIEENPSFFMGQSVIVEPLETTPTPSIPVVVGLTVAEIIGIAVGCAVVVILLLVLIVVLVVCILRYRHTHQKSVNFSYGIEYDNPVADDDDIEPVSARPLNGADITVVAPNIYVNPGGEEEPKAKEAAVADEKAAERDEGASNSDRSMQSLILKFGEDDDASQHSVEKEELTSL